MSAPEANPPIGLLLSDDLLFTSRITATASALGLSIKTARSADVLKNLAAQQAPACVIVDLANPGLNIAELVSALQQHAPPPRVVAYGAHVDTATLKKARDAGCDPVLPRSKFVEDLAALLPEWFGVK